MREGWRHTTLGEAIEVTMGRQRSPKHAVGEHIVPYLRAANVKDGRLQLDSVFEMNFSPAEQATFSLRPGDVLVTEGCGSIGQLGAAARWDSQIGGVVCFQNTLLRLRAIQGVTDPGFVDVWARHAFSSGSFAAVASGTNIFHIGSTQAKQIPLLLPPLVEQRRIVHLISAVDAEIDAAEAATAQGRDALDVVLDELTAEVNCRLGDRVTMGSGPSWKAAQEVAAPVEGALPVIGITNTRPDGRLDMSDRRHVIGLSHSVVVLSPWSLLMIRTNGNRNRIGNVYRVVPQAVGCAFSAFLIGMHPHEPADAGFLYWLLRSPRVQSRISDAASGTTGLGNIAVRWLRELSVPWPSVAIRTAFVETAEALNAVVEASVGLRGALGRLRAALLAELLSGNDVIPDSYDVLLETGS